jgi:hypothetical protein
VFGFLVTAIAVVSLGFAGIRSTKPALPKQFSIKLQFLRERSTILGAEILPSSALKMAPGAAHSRLQRASLPHDAADFDAAMMFFYDAASERKSRLVEHESPSGIVE